MRKTALFVIIVLSQALALSAQAQPCAYANCDPEAKWMSILNAQRMSVALEKQLIEKVIAERVGNRQVDTLVAREATARASIKRSDFRSQTAYDRAVARAADRAQTEYESGFLTQRWQMYDSAFCSPRGCASRAAASARADLNAIQQRMTVEQLRERLGRISVWQRDLSSGKQSDFEAPPGSQHRNGIGNTYRAEARPARRRVATEPARVPPIFTEPSVDAHNAERAG